MMVFLHMVVLLAQTVSGEVPFTDNDARPMFEEDQGDLTVRFGLGCILLCCGGTVAGLPASHSDEVPPQPASRHTVCTGGKCQQSPGAARHTLRWPWYQGITSGRTRWATL